MANEAKKEPILVRVMDRETGKIKLVDSVKNSDFKTKYLHCTGVEFKKEK